jgi:putative transposase
MARISRVVIPTIAHHVTQRGNRNQQVFFSPEDKQEYLRLLKIFSYQEGVEYLAYCLMDNHVHLIAIPRDENSLAKGIGEAHRRYSRMINFRQGWRGYLFQGRFNSCPLDERHLIEAARYVELNPVRAGIVAKAEEYEYSSAKYHVQDHEDVIVKRNPFKASIDDWGEFLKQGVSQDWVKMLRRRTQTGRPCGNDKFVTQLEEMTGRELNPRRTGRKRKMSIVSPE